MIGLGSDKNQNIWKTKKTHQTIHTCESACAFLLRPLSFSWNPCAAHSYAVAIKYARWQIQARGMLGTQAPCSCANLFMRTTHFTLSRPVQAVNAPVEVEQCHTEHTFGGALSSSWIVGTWLGRGAERGFCPKHYRHCEQHTGQRGA